MAPSETLSAAARDEGATVATTAAADSARAHQKAPLWRGRTLLLAAVVLLALNLRSAATSVSPLLDRVSTDLGMGTTAAGLLGMVPTLAFALSGVLTPALARRTGLERAAWIAMVLAAAGQVLRATAGGTVAFLLLSLLALAGMGIGNVVLPPLIKRWFPDRLAALTSGYVLLLALGTAMAPLLAVPMADAAGWRVAVGGWGLFALAAAVPWVLAARRDTRRTRSRRRHPAAGAAARVAPIGIAALRRSPVAWGLVGLIGMTSLNTYAMFAWLPVLLVDAGISASGAGAMLALYAAVGMPTSLLTPWAATRMRNPFPLVLAFLTCYLSGYAGLLWSPASATWVWVVLAGLGPASFPLSLTLVNLRSRTTAGSAALSGFAQGVGYLLAGAGPVVVGALHQATDGWGAAFAFLTATLGVQVVGGAVVCRPRHVEDDLDVSAGPSGRPAATSEHAGAATTLRP